MPPPFGKQTSGGCGLILPFNATWGRPKRPSSKVWEKGRCHQLKSRTLHSGRKRERNIGNSKSLERNILLVVEMFQLKGKIIYRLLFSTDTTQAPIEVIDIYHTCFQIEFGFRDAKQIARFENSQARSGNKLHLHFNTALTTVNYCHDNATEQSRDKGKHVSHGSFQGIVS
jgi:hypothetical protein